jgi:hypothetical protein
MTDSHQSGQLRVDTAKVSQLPLHYSIFLAVSGLCNSYIYTYKTSGSKPPRVCVFWIFFITTELFHPFLKWTGFLYVNRDNTKNIFQIPLTTSFWMSLPYVIKLVAHRFFSFRCLHKNVPFSDIHCEALYSNL